MSDPFQGPAPPPGGPPPRNTPIGTTPSFGSPAPPPGLSQPGYGQPAYGQPPIAQPHWAQPPSQQRGTNGLAIAAFVLGLLWLCLIGSVLGIIFGFVALSQIKRTQQSGKGFAIAGIVLGFLAIIGSVVFFVVAWDTAEDALEQVPGEVDDVSLVSCGVGASGRPEAVLEVTNDSSKSSAYVIRVEFTGGGDTTESEFSGVESLASNDTVTVVVEARDAVAGDVECDITYVQRLADSSANSGAND